MRIPKYARAARLARFLTIVNQDTSTQTPFALNREQRRMLKAFIRCKRVCILKARQIGSSTASAFFLMMLAMMNDGLPFGIIAHNQSAADEILGKIGAWLVQLGVDLDTSNVRTLELPNGATIRAMTAGAPVTAGASKAGRQRSFAALLCTEVAFWSNARGVWAALEAAALKGARFIWESTGSPEAGSLFRKMWEGGEWESLWFSVEEHEGYALPADSISDETWAHLQATYGFTVREGGAWWAEKLRVGFSGDEHSCLREFPVIPAHAWIYQVGQYTRRWVERAVKDDGRVRIDERTSVREAEWNEYVPESDWNEPVIMGVDPALGEGGDNSAVVLVGHKTGRVLRTWRRNDVPLPELIDWVRAQVERFKPVTTIIEDNGVGIPVLGMLKPTQGTLVVRQHSTGPNTRDKIGELHMRRAQTRMAIEDGTIHVGGHLLDECMSCTLDDKGKFQGRDDVTSALSYCLSWRAKHPYVAPYVPPDRSKVFIAQHNRPKRKKRVVG